MGDRFPYLFQLLMAMSALIESVFIGLTETVNNKDTNVTY